MLGPAESTMLWVYCYSLMMHFIKNLVQVVLSVEESALTDVFSNQLLPG